MWSKSTSGSKFSIFDTIDQLSLEQKSGCH